MRPRQFELTRAELRRERNRHNRRNNHMPKAETPESEVVGQSDAWIAENPGDSITGKVTDLDVAWSDFRARHAVSDPNGGNYPLITIRTPEGETRKIHAFRTVLYNEVVKRQPKPGE